MGVNISTINRSLMYAEGAYKSRELALSTYREIPLSASASACLPCSGRGESSMCAARCVNGLNIAARMEQARKMLA